MTKVSRKNRLGFSLIELLAVVLVMAVLAAVAVPLYLNTRKSSAARACKGTIATIARAEAAFAVRKGDYATIAELKSTAAQEGLETDFACPLDGDAYVVSTDAAGATAISTGYDDACYVVCPNASTHASDAGLAAAQASNWQKPLKDIVPESNTTL